MTSPAPPTRAASAAFGNDAVSSAVRAAACRALADSPGVVATGPASDARGRAGVGLKLASEPPTTVIIDPDGPSVLTQSMSGGAPEDQVVYLEAGWTDGPPHVPSVP
ncbi:hypothetical protein [Actinomadura atramentaria]|uniref:hypothetical protein n=1 Tax=Actinomadura atramentaria TaxID=1990 RepID=UPI0003605E65|nr:hypothetical protein [Actinomadura atramentaria]